MGYQFTTEQATQMRRDLGLPPRAGAAEILAATRELLELRAADLPSSEPVQVPAGYVAVPVDEVAAASAELQNACNLFLDSVRGKYIPENRDAWAEEFLRDPAATMAHFDQAPVVCDFARWWNAGPTDEAASDDGLYAALFGDPPQNIRTEGARS